MKSKKAQTTNVQIVDGKPVIIEEKIGNEPVKKQENEKLSLLFWIIILIILLVSGILIYYFFFK